MKIFVKAKPGSKINKIEVKNDNHFEVWVKEPAIQGKANEAIIKSLAEYFKISSYQIKIISGHYHKNKIIEIIV